MGKKVGLTEIKQALRDGRFRDSLPKTFQDDIVKYLNNPTCTCNLPLYRKILKECREQLIKYFPQTEIMDEEKEISNLAENNWTVINCSIYELEEKLRKLPKGRKQIDIARFQDQITIVVNELDVIY